MTVKNNCPFRIRLQLSRVTEDAELTPCRLLQPDDREHRADEVVAVEFADAAAVEAQQQAGALQRTGGGPGIALGRGRERLINLGRWVHSPNLIIIHKSKC